MENTFDMEVNGEMMPYATHPGAVLKDEIEYQGISQKKLAQQMGISFRRLNEILNARRPLTEDIALMFEAAFGVDAKFLMYIQQEYTMRMMMKDPSFMNRLADMRSKMKVAS